MKNTFSIIFNRIFFGVFSNKRYTFPAIRSSVSIANILRIFISTKFTNKFNMKNLLSYKYDWRFPNFFKKILKIFYLFSKFLIVSTLTQCLPPANFEFKKISTLFKTSSMLIYKAPNEIMFASLCSLINFDTTSS